MNNIIILFMKRRIFFVLFVVVVFGMLVGCFSVDLGFVIYCLMKDFEYWEMFLVFLISVDGKKFVVIGK